MSIVAGAMIRSNHRRFRSLQREALEWLTRVTSGEATVAELRQFEAWRAQSETHAEAYRSVLGLWRSLEVASRETATAGDRAIIAGRQPPPSFSFGRRACLAGGLVASAAAVSEVVVRPPLDLWPSLSELLADYHTGAGERRTVRLTDGVSAELNTRTAIGRRSGTHSAAIELISGEVAISSARSDDDPFIVLAGAGRTRSAHTKFDIRHYSDLVRVTCLEGTVQVEHTGRSVTLRANQQLSYSDSGIGQANQIDPAIITAWQQGLLIFHDEPLSQVIEEVNRYWSGRIILLDGGLGRRRVTARVELARIGEVISYIQTTLGAGVRTLPGSVVLLS